MITTLKYIFIAMRPEQWIKNLFIFAGIIFSGNLLDIETLSRVFFGSILFSLCASSIYMFNDIRDLEYDRAHPKKKYRPLAAGLLSTTAVYTSSVILIIISVTGALILDWQFFAILATYIIINVAYTMKIKELVILDVMCIASGFVLRVLAGTTLASVNPSDWLIVCTITLSLFLGFSKRRHELILTTTDTKKQRKVLGEYSTSFLDQMISIATACTLIAYALYTISPETVSRFGTRNLIFTMPFVLFGIYRYLYLIHQKNKGENLAREFYSDFPLLANGILWFLTVAFIIYRRLI